MAKIKQKPEAQIHPTAKAWREWLASEEGRGCAAGQTSGEYLKNRLWKAFNAGVEHGEKLASERKAGKP